MMMNILEEPVTREILEVVERQEYRRKIVRLALEAAAMSDEEFVTWYVRNWYTLPRGVGSERTARRLEELHELGWPRDLAMLRCRIVRSLALEAIQ